MHITELRIAGFKSFVDPQEVPVLPGLTGIVGPNGCGKSNLLEALRWAMGASSAKAMRGGEMDDLIFSGSQQRPARELAEVTLVLDNSKRTAPPEFNASDVLEIQRRLKRGAGSTYKLNGRTVRGKDIQLIFADASTGANSPSLVRQGQISELIGSKPQNRRRILEEAAGISGLNTRRHEAELKLRAAETNLERLSEVSAEVERQLESLKRQARKARKYKELSERISALEAFLAHLKWEAAREAKAQAEAELARCREAVEQSSRAAAVAETRRIEAGEGLQPLRDAEAVVSGKLGQARIDLARLETERKNAADLLARHESEARRLMDDIQREQAQKDEAAQALEEAKDNLAALPTEDPKANEELEAKAKVDLEAAREQLNDAQAAADDVAAKLASMKAERQAAEASAEAQRRRKASLEADANRLNQQLTDMPDTAALQAKLAEAEKAEETAEMALHDAERAVDAAEATLAEAREAEAEAQGPKDEADQVVRTLESEIAALERLLKQASGPKAPPVIDRVRTRDGYEKAVAAALGDDLQASTQRDSSLYWAGSEIKTDALPAGAEPLHNFVEAPGELAARLSQCGVVSVEDGARLATGLKPGQRLVTTEGHLWRWDGFTRTPDAPVSAAERLAQQARLEAAQAEIGPARDTLDEAADALCAAKAQRAEAEDDLKEARKLVSPKASELNRARSATAETRQAFERADVKRESASEALARVESDLRGVEESLALVSIGGDDTELERLETIAIGAREALTRAREHETECRGRLADITRNREQAIARREGFQKDVERWTGRLANSEQRLQDLLKRRSEAAADAERARSKPEEMQGQIDALAERVAQFEEERKQAADRLAEKESTTRESEQHARETANAAMEARESLAGAKVRLENAESRLEDAVETARTQFQRMPEGLMTLARAGIDEEELETLEVSEADRQLDFLRRDRDQLGGVNMEAEAEAEELAERLGTQASEKEDLIAAIAKLRDGVAALNDEGRARLLEAFERVNEHFKALFTTLFRGGEAELRLVDSDDPLDSGLEIMAQPPGKRLGTLSLMSGGEQALTATALIFAVFLSRPSPICVLDEVDAPLDDANVDRYCRLLDEMRRRTDTRFIVITHNPVTMSRMDRLFGVTMREKGVSKLVSVDLDAAEELVAAE
ncbi:chromosome segregation protein SMC [Henriciella mobilis]|uniref:chromosome segregation protein SMC n=1 Tax=Henriciella mobilis TaxID=2305467 RepID=UPI000E661851|nr:chromosome segregation protein SMC [Henriciella mobilis]RIJ13899.1 chromosome segregation protein SMC [Henriciella mobilis]RIJ20891.1 chromosome segregation protein SMC [Henriciella mobilis]